ncbi:hypothetical protein C8J56DRAFT_1024267 [Mycena floridula]|nr:hypothetical protein C8J56DRAFT_1024267 [Mycena floridula]
MACINCGFLPVARTVSPVTTAARERILHASRENVLLSEVEILETKAKINVERSAIELLKQRIRELEREVEVREWNLQHYRSIVSPVRRIPNEILGDMFQLVVDDAVSKRSCALFNQAVPPWPLAVVCAHWRQVVSSSMSLWATFDINIDEVPSYYGDADSGPKSYISLARDYLRRSGDHPLNIILQHHKRGIGFQPIPERLFGLFLEHSSRWSAVKLNLSPLSLLHMSASTMAEFTILYRLELTVRYEIAIC